MDKAIHCRDAITSCCLLCEGLADFKLNCFCWGLTLEALDPRSPPSGSMSGRWKRGTAEIM